VREVQKKNTFFFLLPSGSTLDLQVKGTNKWEKYKRKTPFSFYFRAEVPWTFRSEVRISERKTKCIGFFPSVSTDLTQKALNTINLSLLFMGYLENYRIFVIPNLGVLYYCKIQKRAETRSSPDCYLFYLGKRPTSWDSIKAQIKTSCSIKKYL